MLAFFSLFIHKTVNSDVAIIGTKKIPAQQPKKKKKKLLIEPVFKFQAFDGKIYVVSDSEGKFLIDVYDHNGTFLRKIKREYNRTKISDDYKKIKFDEFKNIPVIKQNWDRISKRMDISFLEYFPAIEGFRVRDGKIYVKTYKPGKDGLEFLVLDLQGKLLSSSSLPDIKIELWDIGNNHFYYLNSNEDQEMWELHSIKIQ